jgi:hypothetical protein
METSGQIGITDNSKDKSPQGVSDLVKLGFDRTSGVSLLNHLRLLWCCIGGPARRPFKWWLTSLRNIPKIDLIGGVYKLKQFIKCPCL